MTPRVLHLADRLSLPADEAVTQKYGFIGRSGSGKSYAAMRLAELFLGAGAQVIALDWVGIWWSLRLASNGKDQGFEDVYIFGGEHADVDLRPESGALMADLVVDKHISVVLDVMHFRKAERTRFATAFAEQFFHRKKTARTACHLFIEEAQAYLPQMVRGDEARMVGVFEDIGKVGRNYGIGNSLISQRPQAINKDVLNQVEVLLAFQTNGPQERKAIAGWTAENTDAGAAMVQELPKLHVGEALVWSPQWLRLAQRVHIGKRETYDASSTPTQHAKAIKPKTLAPADLEQLGQEIAATIEKAKADDPRELRKALAAKDQRIRELETANNEIAEANDVQVKEKRVEVLTDADRALLEKVHGKIHEVGAALTSTVTLDLAGLMEFIEEHLKQFGAAFQRQQFERRDAFVAAVDGKRFGKLLGKLDALQPPQSTSRQPAVTRTAPPTGRSSAATRPNETRAPRVTDGSGLASPSLPPGEHATLTAALQYPTGLDRKRLGILTGYKRSSRDAYIARLSQKGLVDVQGQLLYPTDTGRAAMNGSFEPLPTGSELVEYWRRRLPEGERKTLDVLLQVPGADIAREVIDNVTGYRRSSRDAYLGRLKARGLVEFSGRGTVRSSADLLG